MLCVYPSSLFALALVAHAITSQHPDRLNQRKQTQNPATPSAQNWPGELLTAFPASQRAAVYAACGSYCGMTRNSVTSLSAQLSLGDVASGDRLPVYIIADVHCFDNFSLPWAETLPGITLHVVKLEDALPADSVYKRNLGRFGECTLVRLHLSEWIPVTSVIYLDSDTLVSGPLDQGFEFLEREGYPMAMAEEVSPWYAEKPRNKIKAGKTGYNAGVLGIRTDLWKSMDVDTALHKAVEQAAQGAFKQEMPDQDLLNWAARQNNSLLGTFPPEMNIRWDSLQAFMLEFGAGDEPKKPVVLHANAWRYNHQWSGAVATMNQLSSLVLADASAHRMCKEKRSLWACSSLTFSDLPTTPFADHGIPAEFHKKKPQMATR